MKKFAFTLVATAAALFLGTTAASAQNFSWGPKVGFNVSSMSNTEMNAKVGLTAGVFGEIRIGQWIDLQAELLYSRQGVTDKYTEEGIKVKDRLKSHYLNIPVLANFYVTENLALKTGVQAGFCLGARAIEKIDSEKTKFGAGDAFHTADISIPVGISYDLGPIVLDARYNFGVSHALKAGDSRNNVFQLTAGIRF